MRDANELRSHASDGMVALQQIHHHAGDVLAHPEQFGGAIDTLERILGAILRAVGKSRQQTEGGATSELT